MEFDIIKFEIRIEGCSPEECYVSIVVMLREERLEDNEKNQELCETDAWV